MRANCLQPRRKAQRAHDTINYGELSQRYKNNRRELKNKIKESQRRCLKELIYEADQNPLGTTYKIMSAKSKISGSPNETCPILLKKIVENPLSPAPSKPVLETENISPENVPEVTAEDILAVVNKFKPNSTPGPDMIPNRAIKIVAKKNVNLFVTTMQKCLSEGTFPQQWKMQKLVLLPKPGKPLKESSSYRPICILDTAIKILEGIIKGRLVFITEIKCGLSPNQFGFRKTKSTVNAINKVIQITRKVTNTKTKCKTILCIVQL